MLGHLEEVSGFASQEANLTVVLPLDQMLAAIVADELNAVAIPSVGVFFLALECELVDEAFKADVWLISAGCQRSSFSCLEVNWTHALHLAASAASRSRGAILSRRYAPRYGVDW